MSTVDIKPAFKLLTEFGYEEGSTLHLKFNNGICEATLSSMFIASLSFPCQKIAPNVDSVAVAVSKDMGIVEGWDTCQAGITLNSLRISDIHDACSIIYQWQPSLYTEQDIPTDSNEVMIKAEIINSARASLRSMEKHTQQMRSILNVAVLNGNLHLHSSNNNAMQIIKNVTLPDMQLSPKALQTLLMVFDIANRHNVPVTISRNESKLFLQCTAFASTLKVVIPILEIDTSKIPMIPEFDTHKIQQANKVASAQKVLSMMSKPSCTVEFKNDYLIATMLDSNHLSQVVLSKMEEPCTGRLIVDAPSMNVIMSSIGFITDIGFSPSGYIMKLSNNYTTILLCGRS